MERARVRDPRPPGAVPVTRLLGWVRTETGGRLEVHASETLGALQLVDRTGRAVLLSPAGARDLAEILRGWTGDDEDQDVEVGGVPYANGWIHERPDEPAEGHVAGQLPLPEPWPTLADRLAESARLLRIQGGERELAALLVDAAAGRLR